MSRLTAKCEDTEQQLVRSEERANALSESIQHMRLGLEAEVDAASARANTSDQQLQLSRDTVHALTAELEVCVIIANASAFFNVLRSQYAASDCSDLCPWFLSSQAARHSVEHVKMLLNSEGAARGKVESELLAALAKVSSLSSELSANQSASIELHSKLAASNTSLEHASRQLATMNERNSSLTAELSSLAASRASLVSQVTLASTLLNT